MTSATALKFPVAPGLLELAKSAYIKKKIPAEKFKETSSII